MTVMSDTGALTGTWVVDAAHSSVEFQVKHMGLSTVKGGFEQFEGRIDLPDDLGEARASGMVQVASLSTREATRDEHLRSPDFFDAERYPEIRFESTTVQVMDDAMVHIEGRLAMHGVVRDIVLNAVLQGIDTDPWGNERLGLEVVGQINRADFDMKFNQMLGSGNKLVGDRVLLVMHLSAVRAR